MSADVGARRRRRRAWAVLAIGVIAAGLAGVGGYHLYLARPMDPGATAPVRVSIPRGTGMWGAVDRLAVAGVVRCPPFFLLHTVLSGRTAQLRAGTYTFDLALTPRAVLDALVQGPAAPHLVLTVREGATFWDVAEGLADLNLAPRDEIERLLRDRGFAAELGIAVPSALPEWASPLEGYLYPETYHVDPDRGPAPVVRRMVAEHRKVTAALRKRYGARVAALQAELGLDDRDLVTLAALVEAEVRVREEAPTVAGVFVNRLRRGMKLQTDPTLVYHPDHHRAVPRPHHRRDATLPYNTYARPRLPPGPIGNPGRAALAAAMDPAAHDLLYFVARADGSGRHEFSRTGAEHEAAVRRIYARVQERP